MKKLRFVCAFVALCMMFTACALEGMPVIGPAGGYVFYDKGHYSDGWRYIECAKEAFLKSLTVTSTYNKDKREYEFDNDFSAIKAEAEKTCTDYNSGGYSDWDMPTAFEAKQMLKLWKDGIDPKLWDTKDSYSWSYTHWGYWTTNGIVNTDEKPKASDFNYERKHKYYARPVRRF